MTERKLWVVEIKGPCGWLPTGYVNETEEGAAMKVPCEYRANTPTRIRLYCPADEKGK